MPKFFKKKELEYLAAGGVVAGAYTYYTGNSWLPWAVGGAVAIVTVPFIGFIGAGAAAAAAYVATTPGIQQNTISPLAEALMIYG